MLKLLALALSLTLAQVPEILCRVTTGTELVVLEGESLKIPCPYEPQYASYVKYWCHGKTREFCSSLARTDDTKKANPAEVKASISDDPAQLMSTVTMNDLKEADSGWYLCGVEIGSAWTADSVHYTHINVVHGLSVESNQVSGEEGSSVTVACSYSKRHRESEKKWCRSGDWSSCVLTGSEGSYEDTSVTISDDRTRTFTVTLKNLQMRNTSWYWCLAGQNKIAVHVQVTPRPTITAGSGTSPVTASQSPEHLSAPKSTIKQSWNSHISEILLVCSTVALLVVTMVLGRKLWRLQYSWYQFREHGPEFRPVRGEEGEGIHDKGHGQNVAVVLPNREEANLLTA